MQMMVVFGDIMPKSLANLKSLQIISPSYLETNPGKPSIKAPW